MTAFLLPGAIALLLIAALPVALEWIARRAVRRAETDRSQAWFGGAVETQWAVLGFWGAWFMLCLDPSVRRGLRMSMADDLASAALLVLLVLPPLALSAWAQWRLAELGRMVRSTEGDSMHAMRRMLRPVLVLLLVVLVFGMGPALVSHGVPLIPLLAGGIVLALAAIAATRTPEANETPNAVTAGELRDRIVAIARRAGVRVRQLYVMPQTRARMANAFAAQNNTVLITDYLLAHLDRDEVDAVMAHELAHLHRQDPQRMLFALLGVSFVTATAFVATRSVAPAGIAFAGGMLGFFAMCRKFEYGADAGAIQLGARPESLISGLARLARLNHIPARWGRLLEWTLTHPSLERRAGAIASRAGLWPEAVRSLLDPPGAPESPYELPPALAGSGKVFSTALKTRRHARAGWLLLLVSVLAPAALLGLLAGEPALPRFPLTALAVIAAIASTAAAGLVLSRFPHRLVRRRLGERLAARGLGAHVDEATFVGMSPGSDARVVEGFFVWDAGFLKIASGHLDYVGEETSFSMPVHQVQKIDLVSGPPALLRTRCVRLTWLDGEGSWCTMRLFALTPGAGKARGREPEQLFQALDAWLRAGESPVAREARLSFGAPRHHEVTSVAPRDLVRPATVVTSAVLQLVLALMVTGLAGLPLAPWVGPGWLEVLVAAVAGNLTLMVPWLLHREPARIERRSEVEKAA